jgi:hypothetical protein
MTRLLSKLLKKACTCFDRAYPEPVEGLSTNGKSAKISTSGPFALSVSKPVLSAVEGGERGVFQHSVKNRPFAGSRWVWQISMAVFACVIIAPSLVHAHGMGGEELGPPIVTSGLLGFVCYWLVVLWPSAKEKVDPAGRFGGQNRGAPRVKRKPRLRIIETHSQSHTDQHSGRSAIDA